MSNVQMIWSLCAELCVCYYVHSVIESEEERSCLDGDSGAVLTESRHGEGQTDKQGLYQRQRSDSDDNLYLIHDWMGSQ